MPTQPIHMSLRVFHRMIQPATAVTLTVAVPLAVALLGTGAPADQAARQPNDVVPAAGDRVAGASRLAGVASRGISGLSIQNRECGPSAQSATIAADYYPQSGGKPSIPITRPNVGPCAAANYYPGAESRLSKGLHAVIVSADRPTGVLESTYWYASGGVALGGQSEPGPEVVLPWVVKAAGGMTSIVSVQNTDPYEAVTAEIAIVPAGAAAPLEVLTRTIPPGTSVTLDFGGMRNLELVRLPPGFVGHLRARAATPLAVQSFVDWETAQKGVAAFEGMPAERAAGTLFAPLVYNLAEGGKTWIAVANPGGQGTDVTVTYRTRGPRCPAAPIVHGGRAHRVAAGTMLVFDQRPDQIPAPPPGPSGLPAGCVGSATIEAAGGGKVIASVVAAGAEGTTLAAYTAGGQAEGGRQVLLPMFRHRHTNAAISTGVVAMNLGAAPATAVLEVRDSTGAPIAAPCPECAQTIAPLEAYTWYPPTMPSLQPFAGTYGSATVRADQPLAVVVNDASGTAAQDAAIYTGIPAVDHPVATPNPGGTPAATPTSTPTPAHGYVPIFLYDADLRDGGERPWATQRRFLPLAERH